METSTYVYSVFQFYDLKKKCWSGAIDTLEIIEEHNKEDKLINLLNELILNQDNECIELTKLNDYLWFDRDFILEELNIENK